MIHDLYDFIVALQIYQMLSDLGGNLGLYIGASLFTFFECTQFLFDSMLWCFGKQKPRKHGKENERETQGTSEEFYQVRL